MLGLAVGDALGWPMEDRGGRVGGTAKVPPMFDFVGWRRREGGGYAPHEQLVNPGEYSDDTQLALAVARSRTVGDNWWTYLTEVELPVWTTYDRGGGAALKHATQSWLRGRPPWEGKDDATTNRYFAAGGNGAVMRCLPHCIVTPPGNWPELNSALDLDAVATHGHPRALVGARLYAAAVMWALWRETPLSYGGLVQHLLDTSVQWSADPKFAESIPNTQFDGRGWYEEWVTSVEEAIRLLRVSVEGLGEGAVAVDTPVLRELGAFGRTKGAGTITAVAAIFLASRYASQPQQGLLAAAFARGGDTDTLASLTAALLGALHGPDWLEHLAQEVQDSAYFPRLVDHLLDQRSATLATAPWRAVERTNLYRWLDGASTSQTTSLGPFGQTVVADIEDYDTRASFVRVWRLQTEIGQTLQIKRYERRRAGRPRWRELASPGRDSAQNGTPRAGLVLEVADLDRARRFYELIVGLGVRRETEGYVSFGWLMLELDDRRRARLPQQLELDRPTNETGQAIRVYVTEQGLERARAEVDALGLASISGTPQSQQHSFRCFDPDGHPVEFVARVPTAKQ